MRALFGISVSISEQECIKKTLFAIVLSGSNLSFLLTFCRIEIRNTKKGGGRIVGFGFYFFVKCETDCSLQIKTLSSSYSSVHELLRKSALRERMLA
jgi:hypothetical protein